MESDYDPDRSPFSEEEVTELNRVAEDALLREVRELREQNQRLSDRVSQYRAKDLASVGELARVRAELEACKNNLSDLNLLDGFLRSGVVRSLDLNSDPVLKEMLTTFLGRALQTALDTGATKFSTPMSQVRYDQER